MASAISRRPWPTFTTARPAKPSSSFLPRSVHTHTPSARSMTSSSSGSHGWSWVLWVQRCLIASPLVVMSAPPLSPPMLSSAHVHRRDRCRRNLHRPHRGGRGDGPRRDRKSTRLNSSHSQISYAVFCLKKKNKHTIHTS